MSRLSPKRIENVTITINVESSEGIKTFKLFKKCKMLK